MVNAAANVDVFSLLQYKTTIMAGRPYIYLWSVAVKPGNELQGLGAAMVEWVLAAADMHNVPVALECTDAVKSETFFTKYGFQTVQSHLCQGSDQTWVVMIREPPAPGQGASPSWDVFSCGGRAEQSSPFLSPDEALDRHKVSGHAVAPNLSPGQWEEVSHTQRAPPTDEGFNVIDDMFCNCNSARSPQGGHRGDEPPMAAPSSNTERIDPLRFK